ncbi:hypothetical protein BCR39DRAFT_549321 [Naematelia encephala]|uniref:Transcriptional adapter 2 n=1 Tax=Naematelia encephala TaxID=71784 RepID=A0A1Y2ALK3_9TREE|nr:hypothetical protein BCR39DRAFT_549321 [Naematelia encephala]
MTVTQRRVRIDPANPDSGGAIEPGIKVTCDHCHVDITHTVRVKCAAKECEEVDFCASCFCEGREVQKHKAWHDYKVVEQHSQPIFVPDWGADEELLLVSGLIINGLGNWAEVAAHVGTRTKEECEKHYVEVFLGGEESDTEKKEAKEEEEKRKPEKRTRRFMPPMHRTFNVDPDEFQARKKARIEDMRKPHALPSGPIGPLVSAPTNHEVQGYMPGRLEFEHEVDNDAELVIKDFEFGLVHKFGGDEQPQAAVTRPTGEEEDEEGANRPDKGQKQNGVKDEVKMEEQDEDSDEDAKPPDTPEGKKNKGKMKAPPEPVYEFEDEDELEVKLALLDIYFSKLDKREEAKEIIFDRGLTEHKKIQAMERKRPKEERELVQRYKVFAKLVTAQDFEVLTEGLVFEQMLRKRIAELQEYRRMGITTGPEAEAYDNAKATRAGYRPVQARDRVDVLPTGARINAGQHRFLHGTPPPGADSRKNADSRDATPRIAGHGARKPPAPLNLANAASLDLLSSEEQSLCSALRVLPKPYLVIKEIFIRENERRKGQLKRREARRMMRIDVNKSGRIFDFLVSSGMLILAYDPSAKGLGPGKEGHVLGMVNGHLGSVQMTHVHGLSGVNGVSEIHLGDEVG